MGGHPSRDQGLRRRKQINLSAKEMSDLEDTFKRAAAFVSSGSLKANTSVKLALYGFYKQATQGPSAKAKKPNMFQVSQKAKWDAWSNCGDMSKEEAMKKYIEVLGKRAPNWDKAGATAAAASSSSATKAEPEGLARNLDVEESVEPETNFVVPEKQELKEYKAKSVKEAASAAAAPGSFVTGATGFLGKHLLKELLKRGNPVFVLVRQASLAKLLNMVATRFPGQEQSIVPVIGDITQPGCGISAEDLATLTGKVNIVFHLAASYDLEMDEVTGIKNNIDGTKHVIELADQLGATLQYTSSVVVAGDYSGTFLESMYDEGQKHSHPYFESKFKAEGLVRASSVKHRIYRPGIVIGSSETGEADKIDGPYYVFKTIQRMRRLIPQWVIVPCIRGGTIPLVPVDYVVKAMDHIAHQPDLDGRTFHLTDPNATSMLGILNTFARAAHAPLFSSTIPRLVGNVIPQQLTGALAMAPTIAGSWKDIVSGYLRIPVSVLDYLWWKPTFDDSETHAALDNSTIRCPPLKEYAWKIWDFYERHMDPSLDLGAALHKACTNKIVVVTGASDGIGADVAKHIALAGAKTILVARTFEKLEVVRKEIEEHGGSALSYTCDLSSEESCDAFVKKVIEDHGRVDVLVNNAGRSIRRSVEFQYDRFHDFTRCIQLNYFGSLKLVLGLLPGMRERKCGHIINVSSIGAQTNAPRFSAYVASKAAFDAFSRCIASEIARDQVFITTIYMPLVRTKMIAPTNIYRHFPTLSTEQASQMILRAVVTKEKKVATRIGTIGEVMYALAPGLLDHILNVGYRLMPEKGKESDIPTSEALVVAHMLQGLHL